MTQTVSQCQKCGTNNVEQKIVVWMPMNDTRSETIADTVRRAELWCDEYWCVTCQKHITKDDIDEIEIISSDLSIEERNTN